MEKITVYVCKNIERREIKVSPRTRIRKCFKRAGFSIPHNGVVTIDGLFLTDAELNLRLKDFDHGKIVYLIIMLKCANWG